MRLKNLLTAGAAMFTFLIPSAYSQTVNLWPGAAPGSEGWEHSESTVEDTSIGTVVFNVVTPTMTAYLPDPAKATGTAIIIAPGGRSSHSRWI
jgi:hypothetical protein